jgi:hypothetical protein
MKYLGEGPDHRLPKESRQPEPVLFIPIQPSAQSDSPKKIGKRQKMIRQFEFTTFFNFLDIKKSKKFQKVFASLQINIITN